MVIPANALFDSLLPNRKAPANFVQPNVLQVAHARNAVPRPVPASADALLTSLLGPQTPSRVRGAYESDVEGGANPQYDFEYATLEHLGDVEGRFGGDATNPKLDKKTFPYGLTLSKIRQLGSKTLPELFKNGKPRFTTLKQVEAAAKSGEFVDQDWREVVRKTIPHFVQKIDKQLTQSGGWAALSHGEKVGVLSQTWNLNKLFPSLIKILGSDVPEIDDINEYISNYKSKGKYLKGLVTRRILDLNPILRAKGQPIITEVVYKNIRKPGKYTIKKGDTLSKIAKSYKNISLKNLLDANELKKSSIIHPKQKLIIPGRKGKLITTMSLTRAGSDELIPNTVHNSKNRILQGQDKQRQFKY